MTVASADRIRLPVFGDCAEGDLHLVAEATSTRRAVDDGDVICVEGDPADRWWIVVDGSADVTVDGLYVATIGPGETIGELGLLDGEPRAATVTAVTPMELHEVDGAAFLEAVQSSPHLSLALLRQLARRLRAANRRPAAPRPPAAPPAPVRWRAGEAGAPTELDPSTPGFFDDPAAHLAILRETAPVHWSAAMSSYVVTRYDDVHDLARSRTLVGSIATLPGTEDRSPGHRMMIRKDGADHARLRRLVSKVFTPRAITQWRDRADAIVERLLAAAVERDELDVIADYALPLPAQVISDMLGMPPHDTAQLRAWSHTLTKGLDPFLIEGDEHAVEAAGRAMTEYLTEVIADKRRRPADDILSALLHAEVDGDFLDDRDVRAQVLMLYIAGHETTLNLIGNGVHHLFRFPDQLDRLRTDPALDANTVEEVLRFESPAQLTRRVAVEPLVTGGLDIPAGSHVTLALASANRDPRKWGPTADVLDLARRGANEHTSFGAGPHYCLGAALARLEAAIALPRLVRRFPRMTPAYSEPRWMRRVALRGLETLPVTLR